MGENLSSSWFFWGRICDPAQSTAILVVSCDTSKIMPQILFCCHTSLKQSLLLLLASFDIIIIVPHILFLLPHIFERNSASITGLLWHVQNSFTIAVRFSYIWDNLSSNYWTLVNVWKCYSKNCLWHICLTISASDFVCVFPAIDKLNGSRGINLDDGLNYAFWR